MEAYGTIWKQKNEERRISYPQILPPMFLLKFNALILKVWNANIRSDWFTRLKFGAIIRISRAEENLSREAKIIREK